MAPKFKDTARSADRFGQHALRPARLKGVDLLSVAPREELVFRVRKRFDLFVQVRQVKAIDCHRFLQLAQVPHRK